MMLLELRRAQALWQTMCSLHLLQMTKVAVRVRPAPRPIPLQLEVDGLKEENAALLESVQFAKQNKAEEVTVLGIWSMVTDRMEEVHGYNRTDNACRIQYNRKTRRKLGYDERGTPKPHRVATSRFMGEHGRKDEGRSA